MRVVKVIYETALVKKEIEFTGKTAGEKALKYAINLRKERQGVNKKHNRKPSAIYLKITFEQYEKEDNPKGRRQKLLNTLHSIFLSIF